MIQRKKVICAFGIKKCGLSIVRGFELIMGIKWTGAASILNT
jgi:hypothetical protein